MPVLTATHVQALDPFAGIEPCLVPPAPRPLFEAAHGRFLLRRPARRERRKAVRFYIGAEALARPLAEDGSPAGAAFRGVIVDLSNDGLRLLHVERLSSPLFAVRLGLPDDAVTLVARLTRAFRVGSHFEHAGPFLAATDLAALGVDVSSAPFESD